MMTVEEITGEEPEALLLPGACDDCQEPLVLVPPMETVEFEGRRVGEPEYRWRWLVPATGREHSCR